MLELTLYYKGRIVHYSTTGFPKEYEGLTYDSFDYKVTVSSKADARAISKSINDLARKMKKSK